MILRERFDGMSASAPMAAIGSRKLSLPYALSASTAFPMVLQKRRRLRDVGDLTGRDDETQRPSQGISQSEPVRPESPALPGNNDPIFALTIAEFISSCCHQDTSVLEHGHLELAFRRFGNPECRLALSHSSKVA